MAGTSPAMTAIGLAHGEERDVLEERTAAAAAQWVR
jgi:hypothetical protein